MKQNLEKFKKDINWEEKAKTNPLFAIMSDDVFKDSNAQPSESELEVLYTQGEKFWKKWFQPILWDKQNIKSLTLLEYGCGMGRIINYPAREFGACYGVDISDTQIAYAKQYCPNHDVIDFLPLQKTDLSIPLQANIADIVYSYAVMQHIRQKSALVKAVSEMSRVLKEGGKLKVQMRTTHYFLGSGKRALYHSWVGENYTLAVYVRRFSFLWVPVMRLIKHSNWSGAGCFFSVNNIRNLFAKHKVRPDVVEFDIRNNVIWIEGTKIS